MDEGVLDRRRKTQTRGEKGVKKSDGEVKRDSES